MSDWPAVAEGASDRWPDWSRYQERYSRLLDSVLQLTSNTCAALSRPMESCESSTSAGSAWLAPGVEAHARRLGVLGGDEHHVAEAVGVGARGCYEERFELSVVAPLKRGGQFVRVSRWRVSVRLLPSQVLRERGFRFLHRSRNENADRGPARSRPKAAGEPKREHRP